MPWLALTADAPDTARMYADPGSRMESALRASGWAVEVDAPGTTDEDVEVVDERDPLGLPDDPRDEDPLDPRDDH